MPLFRSSCRALLLSALCLAAPASALAAPSTTCKFVQQQQVPISLRGLALQPAVQGSINGKPALMLLDTGAFMTMLTRTGAENRKLALRSGGGRKVLGTGGSSALYLASLDDFTVGPSGGGKITLPVLGEMGTTPWYDAIVGADFLMQSDLEVALADKVVRFHRSDNCNDDNLLSYWDAQAMMVPMTGASRKAATPQVDVQVNGVTLSAILDTGAGVSSITESAARRAGVTTDMPDVKRNGFFIGAGGGRAARWNAVFKTFTIGDETVRNADIAIAESLNREYGQVDVILGTDFLRAHRVLFANSQRRVYLSYLGGEVFAKPGSGNLALVRQEADGGNADAQYILARDYFNGARLPKDQIEARAWLDKAAAQNHPAALLLTARLLREAGRPQEAVTRLRAVLAAKPDKIELDLELFLARVEAGEREAAKRALAAATDTRWPAPVAAFYLGRIDAAALMAAARDGSTQERARVCQAGGYIASLQRSSGELALAHQTMESIGDACKPRKN
ncbi:aspartyl protease family protein [Massilia violaceinigra]|uniref:Aspartyl protease family protein n=1 Tax=Massilia violaceinigra TaxID=2045208 RepID=A0ABY4A9T6_9BURK|nr:retropepsin-like aspartic protease [Massilia violaceinigra]UOD31362.1 aspartyl protease family protein [Massilia violaceinigra]